MAFLVALMFLLLAAWTYSFLWFGHCVKAVAGAAPVLTMAVWLAWLMVGGTIVGCKFYVLLSPPIVRTNDVCLCCHLAC